MATSRILRMLRMLPSGTPTTGETSISDQARRGCGLQPRGTTSGTAVTLARRCDSYDFMGAHGLLSHPVVIMVGMCEICDGASEDEARQQLAGLIEKYGWAITAVQGGRENLSWAYTVGLVERYGHPELVVTSLADEDAGRLLNALGNRVRTGERFAPDTAALVGTVPVRIVAVHPVHLEQGLMAAWYEQYRAFGDIFQLRALQVVLPSEAFCPDGCCQMPRLDLPATSLDVPMGTRSSRRRRRGRHR